MRTVIVNLFRKDTRWATVVCWLAGASTLLYLFSRFIPGTPPCQYPIGEAVGDAWTRIVHVAFSQHLQFGRDIVFTYGPWGFLSRGYYPPTYPVSVIAWLVLSLVFWQAGWQVARHLSNNLLFSWLWLIGFTAVASIPVGDNIDTRLVAWMVLLLFLHFFVEEGPFTSTQAVLVVSLGWLSLVKFTGLIEMVIVVVIIAADNIFRHRRFPWIVPLLMTSFLCFWIAAGQHLGSIGPFLSNSWQITSGYTEAMMLTGKMESQDIGCFLLLGALLCALVGRIAWTRHRFWGGLPLAGLGAILFIIFKEGYVRHDPHEISAAMALLLTSLACLAIAWPGNRRWTGMGGLFVVAISLLFATSVFHRWVPKETLPTQLVRTFAPRNLLAPVSGMFTGYLRDDYTNYLAAIRNEYPLPPIQGEVDLYSWYQTVLFAHGLHYHPRPVVQSYSAYTPELAELNAAYLRTDRAASNILFAIQPMNHRFPTLDDARSWPELLTRYDLKGSVSSNLPILLLVRSPTPREYHLTPLQNTTARFGESVIPPSVTNGLVWAEIDIKRSLMGTLITALYKPPVLELAVSLRGRGQHQFRLVPGMARSGFLLSPVVGDTTAFMLLFSPDWQQNLADLEVMSMSISADTQSGLTVCYQSPMQIRFYRLDYPRTNFNLVISERVEK